MTSPPEAGQQFSIRYLDQIEEGAHLRWVRTGILVALIGYILSLAFEFTGTVNPRSLVGEGSAVLVLAVAAWLSRRPQVTPAAILTVLAVSLEIHSALFLDRSLDMTSVPVLPVLVAGTGILLGARAALWVGFTTAVTAPGAVLLGRMVHGDDPLLHPNDLKIIVTTMVIVVGMALIISAGLRAIGRILEAARQNERRISELVAGNPDGVIGLDDRGRIEAFNPAAEALLGIPARTALGLELDALPLGNGPTLRKIRSGAEGGRDSAPVEQRLVRPDGGEIWVEVLRRPLVRPDGSPGTILVLRDLTQRREVEARAIQLGRIVEEARSEIYVFHRDTLEVLTANRGARENLGYSKEEIRGMAMFQIQPTLTPDGGQALARRLQDGGDEVVTVHTVHHRKDGSAYPVEIRFQKGLIDGTPSILAFGVDISEKESAEEEQRLLQAQLQHAQKMEAVGLLAGGVAHDFNNLLTVIGGCGEILMEIGDEEVRELTQEILDSQERGAALTQQLLAFARRDIIQAEDLSLPEVLRGMEVLIRRVLTERVQLRMDLQEGAVVRADRGQLEQVVLNLAANAKDAMPDGGTLTIRVGGEGGGGDVRDFGEYVALTLSDTGQGMDAKTLERVFEPFFTTKPRGKGTGLGLSTVHGIVSQNGGRIVVESEPGVGTTIRILWPAAAQEPEPGAEGDDALIPLAVRGTVLVAEDEDGARSVIRAVLEKEGYRMVGVEDGREALELIRDRSQSFDLLLTDIIMPGLSGLELAERVRVLRPGLPILFMSGYVDTHLLGPEGGPGSLNLLAKPFRPAELRKRVREVLPTG